MASGVDLHVALYVSIGLFVSSNRARRALAPSVLSRSGRVVVSGRAASSIDSVKGPCMDAIGCEGVCGSSSSDDSSSTSVLGLPL